MSLSPLFRKVVVGLATGTIKVGGSALLPGAWPVVEAALQPVLDELEKNILGEDPKASKQAAERAAAEFENNARLRALWRGALVDELQPLLATQEEMNEDQQTLLLIVAGNRDMLERIEERLDHGVRIDPEQFEELMRGYEALRQTMEATRNYVHRAHPWLMSNDRVDRVFHSLQEQAILLIQENRIDEAQELLQVTEMALVGMLAETPADHHLKVRLGYLYKDVAVTFRRLRREGLVDKYVGLAQETLELVHTDLAPADPDAALDLSAVINGLGNLELIRGNYREAVVRAREAVGICSDNVYAWHDLCASYCYVGHYLGEVDAEAIRSSLEETRNRSQAGRGIDPEGLVRLEHMAGQLVTG